VNDRKIDISPLLPDDATLRARRAALADAVGKSSGASSPGRPRLILSLAGLGARAAIAAAILVRGSGSSPEPAAAQALRRAAAVAEAPGVPAMAPPGPGQFLYTKTKVVQLQGWDADGPGAGPRDRPRYFTANLLGPEANALPALVPTAKEVWTSAEGRTREREALGRIEFLSEEDQRRWEDAGSPPPFAYDPREHQVTRDRSGRPLKEFASRSWRGSHEFDYVARLAELPTEPEALRLALERGPAPGQPRVRIVGTPPPGWARSRTIERLMNILSEPITSPALRAAAFNALAEMPGIALERDVTDVAGRRGDAIVYVQERGFGRQFIFDPRTSKILAQAEMIFGPSSTGEYGVPPDTVFRETAYLASGIVDSTRETAGPVATASTGSS
jgi:hypothetical protein